LVPGMGDDVQAIKAGIIEIADLFVINKSDQPGADRLERELLAMQGLSTRALSTSKDKWTPPIVHTVATECKGVAETLAAIRSFLVRADANDRKLSHWSLRLREMLRERLAEQFANIDFEAAAREVVAHRSDPYTIVHGWIEHVRN